MDLGIKNKIALVTGASAGLGFAAAQTLAEEGARVVINSRSEENLKKAAERINEASGYMPPIFIGDLAEDGVAEKLIADIKKQIGPIDILVSNVGGPPAGEFMEHDKDVWRRSTDLILNSAINLTRGVLSDMKKNKWGRIIYITSIAVRQPVDGLIISNALRAGLTGFAKTISNEFAGYGITINTVCPGYTKTERLTYLARAISESSGKSVAEVYEGWTENIPAGRLGQPEELAALISFLASDKAAYISGSAIAVDGGCYKGLL
jgi:3-oxoacyl-[acyl-carrier protein] reductase